MSGLLHNMSSRPSTQVAWRVAPLGEAVVRFDLDGLAAGVARLAGIRRRRHDGASAFAVAGSDRLAPELDAQWAALGLRGAALVYAPPPYTVGTGSVACPTGPTGKRLRATDPALVLNVLARTRANLLLPATPLMLEPSALDRAICSDDPRLVGFAHATGLTEEDDR